LVSGPVTSVGDQKPSQAPVRGIVVTRTPWPHVAGISLATGNVRDTVELPTYLLDQRLAVGLDIKRRTVNGANDDPRFALISVGLKASVDDLANLDSPLTPLRTRTPRQEDTVRVRCGYFRRRSETQPSICSWHRIHALSIATRRLAQSLASRRAHSPASAGRRDTPA
jgi:hypothetical protein